MKKRGGSLSLVPSAVFVVSVSSSSLASHLSGNFPTAAAFFPRHKLRGRPDEEGDPTERHRGGEAKGEGRGGGMGKKRPEKKVLRGKGNFPSFSLSFQRRRRKEVAENFWRPRGRNAVGRERGREAFRRREKGDFLSSFASIRRRLSVTTRQRRRWRREKEQRRKKIRGA